MSIGVFFCLQEKVVCRALAKDGAKFAFYLYVDGVKKKVSWYSASNVVEFNVNVVQSKVRVEVFVLDDDGGKVRGDATEIAVFGTVNEQGFVFGSLKPSELFLRFKDVRTGGFLSLEPLLAENDLADLISKHCFRHRCDDVQYFLSRHKESVSSSGIQVVGRYGVDEFSIPWSEKRLSLECLETHSERKFMEMFTFASRRHYSARVIKYMARNNFNNEEGLANVRINSAVVFAYKSLELEEGVDEALDMLGEAFSLLGGLDQRDGVRRDPIHFYISLIMARLHIFLLQGLKVEALQDVLSAVGVFNSAEFKGYYSVNYAKILSVGLVLTAKEKDYGRFSMLVLELGRLSEKVKMWVESGAEGWLTSESKYVYALADMVSSKPGRDVGFQVADHNMLVEALRVKTDRFLSTVLEIL